jgi:hypothetical protein
MVVPRGHLKDGPGAVLLGGRHYPDAMSTTQSAAERKVAEAAVTRLVTAYAAEHAALIAAARKALRKRLPAAYEIVYDYKRFLVISVSPSGHGYEGVLALHAGPDGVKLYFHRGKGLPDPEKLLKGSAKLVRFIELESAATLKRPAVVALMEAAIAKSDVPFAKSGRGPVVIRSK